MFFEVPHHFDEIELDLPYYGQPSTLLAGTPVHAVRGHSGKAKAVPPDAISPARFSGAKLIEATRHDIT
jgi:hypothetical protein